MLILILILIDVQYLQNVVFSFAKGSNCQNHFSSDFHPLKNYPIKISHSPTFGRFPSTSYCYLENPMVGTGERKFGILVLLESLIWHTLVLFQHQTQQYKQNLTTLFIVYMDIFQ